MAAAGSSSFRQGSPDASSHLLPEQRDGAHSLEDDQAGAGAPEGPSEHAGREFSDLPPSRLLALFCCINMLNYIDRGMIGSNGVNGSAGCGSGGDKSGAVPGDGAVGVPLDDPSCQPYGIQGDFQLSNFADGLLPTAFLVGLLLASPLFAHASKRGSPARLMALGLSVWCAAVLGCSLSWGLLPLLVCRMLVGVGEASFISLAAPCISDCAPRGKVSLWLACFYLCIPVGFALGFIYGSVIGTAAGWRLAFAFEALLMLPFVLFLLQRDGTPGGSQGVPLLSAIGLGPERELHGPGPKSGTAALGALNAGSGGLFPTGEAGATNGDSSAVPALPAAVLEAEEGAGAGHRGGRMPLASPGTPGAASGESTLTADLAELMRNPVYMRNIYGYSLYTFVTGAFAFWAPKAIKQIFHLPAADILFGGITVLTGITGTLAGGMALDWLGSGLPTAFQLMAFVTLVGGVFVFLAFLCSSLLAFVALICAGEIFLFAMQSPANVVAMESVPPVLRPLAIAFSTIAVHVLGDVPSPPILGALQDATQSFRITMPVFIVVYLPAAAVWYSGSLLCRASLPAQGNSSGKTNA